MTCSKLHKLMKRLCAVQWHPDKHPEDPEGAKLKFQEVQRAYTALMTTDEDEIIAQLAAKKHKGKD